MTLWRSERLPAERQSQARRQWVHHQGMEAYQAARSSSNTNWRNRVPMVATCLHELGLEMDTSFVLGNFLQVRRQLAGY